MKRTLIALAIVAVGFVNLQVMPTSALSVDDVQAQIAKLVAQIQELTTQLNTLRTQVEKPQPPVVIGSAMPAKHRICMVLTRNLAPGAQGDDVRAMQEFLNSEGHLSAQATGYFGPMTREAVAKWQTKEGVSAVGSFGPMSRERIKIWCGGGDGGTSFARPTSGPAPLTVSFVGGIGGSQSQYKTEYRIDFGDGESAAVPVTGCDTPGSCPRTEPIKHTYYTNGSYTATLNKITDPCPDDGDPSTPRCMAAIHQEVVGKAQINVGPIACTKEYKPVCGAKPIVCITTPCNPIPTTYGNRCEMNADGANFLYEGACQTYPLPCPKVMCKLESKCPAGEQAVRTYSGYDNNGCSIDPCAYHCIPSSGNKPPVISGFSGPTTLGVNETGTWTINASDPENEQLWYVISWGDEVPVASRTSQVPSNENMPLQLQATTFTHSYATAGTYTVTMRVRAGTSNGPEAKTSTTVQVLVTGVPYKPPLNACTADAYQCPNGQWVGRTGPNCQFVCN